MDGWPERAAFDIGGRSFDWSDVFLFALLRGEWSTFERRLREQAALLGSTGADGHAAAAAGIEAATTAFRQARGLISVDDTLAWLLAWGLDARVWERALLAESLCAEARHGSQLETSDSQPGTEPTAGYEAVDLLWAEAVCSGDAMRFARMLAGVAALVDGDAGAAGAPPCPETLRSWLGADEAALAARLEGLAGIDAAFHEGRPSRCHPTAIDEIVARHRLTWVGLRGLYVELPKEGAAREVRLRVETDGELLAQVAQEVGAAAWGFECFLEDLPKPLQSIASAAQAGELLGPVPTGSGFVLLGLESRVPPDPSLPAVRRRAEAALEERALARALDEHVRWEPPLREACG